ncbi:hypothetical protein FQA39_LY14853 [Lamprigera yunnana]|nr:hypothetical protein FQA39_LY14853 [Lamprigera yunnana]
MEIDLQENFPIKLEIIKQETYSTFENYEGFQNKEEVKIEPVACKVEPLEQCNVSDKPFETIKLNIHDCTYYCNFCPFIATEERYIKSHIKRHVCKSKFQCEICFYQGAENRDLQRHLQKPHLTSHMKKHADESTKHEYFCNECTFKTPWRSSITTHLRLHKGDRPFHCNECDNKCVTKADLKKHLWTHSNEKPFHCTDCNYKAARKYHLKLHREMHERRRLKRASIKKTPTFTSIYPSYKKSIMEVGFKETFPLKLEIIKEETFSIPDSVQDYLEDPVTFKTEPIDNYNITSNNILVNRNMNAMNHTKQVGDNEKVHITADEDKTNTNADGLASQRVQLNTNESDRARKKNWASSKRADSQKSSFTFTAVDKPNEAYVSFKKRDMYDHFGEFVAGVLRKVGDQTAIIMTNDITNILMKHMTDCPSQSKATMLNAKSQPHSRESL